MTFKTQPLILERKIQKIRPTAKQEEIVELNFEEMLSTGNQEENGNCGNQNQR